MLKDQNLNLGEIAGWWFILAGGQILLQERGSMIPFGALEDLPFPPLPSEQVRILGSYENSPCFLLDLGENQIDMGMGEFCNLRSLLGHTDDALFDLAGKAFQTALFLKTHQYCGQCGNAMELIDWELATKCHQCGHRCYPRVSPCIIVAIRKEKQILLACHQRHSGNGRDMYTVLAGFAEMGENLEQSVAREVMEEVGIKVKNIGYVSSQPWPFPHSLMMGFVADYDSGEIKVDKTELADAQWFDFDNLPIIPGKATIARKLIEKVRFRCR